MKTKHRNIRRTTVILVLVFHLCVPLSLLAQVDVNLDNKIKEHNREKRRLANERLTTLNQINITEKRTTQVIEALRVLGRNIELSRKKLVRLKQSIFNVKKEILRASIRIRKLEEHIEKDKREINRQLQALYTLGRVREMTLFIGLNSFQHYFRNRKLLQNSTRFDIELLHRLNRNLEARGIEKQSLDSHRKELSGLKKKEEDLNKLLQFERQQQATYLQHLRKDRVAHVQYLREIQVKLEQLNDSLYTLAARKEHSEKTRKFKGFFSVRNKLPSPVTGNVVHHFGNKQSPFYTLFRRGVLVETAADAPVRSVLGGKVVWAGPFRGYQNLVILDHGKGSLSVYGNLGEVFVLVNDVVDRGYMLGNVGLHNEEERSLFYFEMRYKKKAVNPERWLKKPRWQN